MIVPGSANPMMWGSPDPLDEFAIILNSVRFNSGDAPSFHRVMGAGANRKKGAISVWLKPTKVVTASISNNGNMHVFMADNSTNLAGSGLSAYSRIAFTGDGSNPLSRLQWNSSGSAGESFITNDLKRDLAGHGHLYVRWNTTVPLLECYWNGVEVSYASKTLPTLNADTIIGVAAGLLKWGMFTTADPRHFDGYMSWPTVWLGSSPAVTDVGRIHPKTKQWRPKPFTGSYGTHDSFMDFRDGSAATAAALGADRSGNGNNFTPTNISVTAGAGNDHSLDTPTSNHCIATILDKVGGSITVSNAGMDVAMAYSATYPVLNCTHQMSSGKWYFEVTATSGAPSQLGVGVRGNGQDANRASGSGGYNPLEWFYTFGSGNKYNSNSSVAYGASIASGDVVGVAYDADAGKLWFAKNGAWQVSGDPAAGTNATFSGINVPVVPSISNASGTSHSASLNFGQRAFAYTPPSGFKALTTKNMKYPAVANVEEAFVARNGAGASIAATLAAAAPWADWIRIYKLRGSSEGWRWQFSDDTGFALESNNTNAKIAFPSLSGASYHAEAIKVSPLNGVATGRLSHTNGAADVVTDGLLNSRKMVMLRNEAGGNWFVYHPDLAAGKLLYLNLQAAETTDATISTVTTSGFTVAAALATGTYRWISFAETKGFLSLWSYIANGSADGPCHSDGVLPSAVWWRDATTGTNNWHLHDSARDPYNPSNLNLIFNLSDAESSQHGMDFLAAGAKLRNSSSGSNLSGTKQIGVTFGQSFRYANGR